MPKLLTTLALAGAAAASFAMPAAASSGTGCTIKECVEAVTGPIHYTGDCIWFDTFPVCKPI